MSAHLRLANGIETPGARMAELAQLWVDVMADGPSLDWLRYVTFSPEQGGTVTAYFGEASDVIRWAEHLGGLVFTREHIAGRTWRVVAAGQVTRGEHTANVVLKANYLERGVA